MTSTRKYTSWLPAMLALVILAWQGGVAYKRAAVDKAVDNANERYIHLIEAAPIAIVTCNEMGKVVTFNSAAEQLFGYQHTEIVGQSIHVLVTGEYRDRHTKVVQAAADRLRAQHENWEVAKIQVPSTAVRKDGSYVSVFVTVYGVKMGDQYEFAAFLTPAACVGHSIDRASPHEPKPFHAKQ